MTKRTATLAAAAVVLCYLGAVRPRLLRWGASSEEVQAPFPGATLVPGGTRQPPWP